jgi:hypothetical protein
MARSSAVDRHVHAATVTARALARINRKKALAARSAGLHKAPAVKATIAVFAGGSRKTFRVCPPWPHGNENHFQGDLQDLPIPQRGRLARRCYGGFLKEIAIHTALSAAPSAITPVRLASTSSRRDHLRAALPSTVDLLYRRRADLIGDSAIGDYVALHWLEWNGGALRLTVTGRNICDQIKAQSEDS